MPIEEKPIHKAYARCLNARSALSDMSARCMETTEDKHGILWERWLLPSGKSTILWATPHGWDLFLPACAGTGVAETIRAVKEAASPDWQGSPAEQLKEALVALRDMVDWLDDGQRVLSDACAADVAKARAAIAKAKQA